MPQLHKKYFTEEETIASIFCNVFNNDSVKLKEFIRFITVRPKFNLNYSGFIAFHQNLDVLVKPRSQQYKFNYIRTNLMQKKKDEMLRICIFSYSGKFNRFTTIHIIARWKWYANPKFEYFGPVSFQAKILHFAHCRNNYNCFERKDDFIKLIKTKSLNSWWLDFFHQFFSSF